MLVSVSAPGPSQPLAAGENAEGVMGPPPVSIAVAPSHKTIPPQGHTNRNLPQFFLISVFSVSVPPKVVWCVLSRNGENRRCVKVVMYVMKSVLIGTDVKL